MLRSLRGKPVIDIAARYQIEHELRGAAVTDAEVESQDERVSLIFGVLMAAPATTIEAVAAKGNALVQEYGDKEGQLVPAEHVARVVDELAALAV